MPGTNGADIRRNDRLFAGQLNGLGALALPLMMFHQQQLMVCAVVARRYAARGSTAITLDDRDAD